MITAVEGVRVGHHTDPDAQTGCTVVVFPAGTIASGEIRGGAPASREFALLAPERLVSTIDAVVMTGGSAFGLAAVDGVMGWCEEHGLGFETPVGRVPIVVGMALFDLAVGRADVRPTAADGAVAVAAASSDAVMVGPIGAGTGATVGGWRGRDHVAPGGLGAAVQRDGELVVAALVVVNAAGSFATRAIGEEIRSGHARPAAPAPFANTTIGVVVTNARLDKHGCFLAAQSGHDGLARGLVPAHTRSDGDALVAAATGAVEASIDWVEILTAAVVEDAVRSVADTSEP